jgi:hypothetical protein
MLGEAPGGFMRETSLLPRPTAEGVNRPPVEMPVKPDSVCAYLAAGIGPDPDACGIVYLAPSTYNTINPPLTVVDWDLIQVQPPTFHSVAATIITHLEQLATQMQTAWGGIAIDPAGIGPIIYSAHMGLEYIQLNQLESLLAMDIAQRALAASGFVNSGAVQITRHAYEKVADFKGILRNHFLHQVVAFGVNTAPNEAGVLLTAFSNCVHEAFSTNPRLLARVAA